MSEYSASRGPVRAKRSLGQNFLQDANIARNIAAALDIEPTDKVLEIGPGQGALTTHILDFAPARCVLLEKDAELVVKLKKRWPEANPVYTDAMTFVWERLAADAEGRGWKVCGNLPYNVASPLMWEIVSRANGLERAVFMIQKEVAQRLAAVPGSRAYGALTVWIQSHVDVRMLFTVPPQVFRPRPKVDSAVVRFMARPEGRGNFSGPALSTLLRLCFQQRRKQLKKILKNYWDKDVESLLESQGRTPQSRPEELGVDGFQALSNLLQRRFAP